MTVLLGDSLDDMSDRKDGGRLVPSLVVGTTETLDEGLVGATLADVAGGTELRIFDGIFSISGSLVEDGWLFGERPCPIDSHS